MPAQGQPPREAEPRRTGRNGQESRRRKTHSIGATVTSKADDNQGRERTEGREHGNLVRKGDRLLQRFRSHQHTHGRS